MHLTPSSMRMFIAVIEERSFTRAAQRENATQSGVSQQIRKLEDSFAVRLLHRHYGNVTPTPAGERLYERCVAIVRGIAHAEDEVRGYGRALEGQVTVGLMPILTRCILGPTLRRMRHDYPNVAVQIREAVSSQLLDLVGAQTVDFAIVPDVDPPDALSISYLGRAREMLITGERDSPLHGKPIDLRTVKPLRLITPSHGNIRTVRLSRYLASIGVEADEMLELDPLFTALEYVSNSDYGTILPNIMMLPEIAEANLCVRPISSPPFHLSLAVVKPRRATIGTLGEVFLDLFTRELKRYAITSRKADLNRILVG